MLIVTSSLSGVPADGEVGTRYAELPGGWRSVAWIGSGLMTQLDGYLDRLGLGTGVLVIFDRRPNAAPVPERTRFEQTTSPAGRQIVILRA